MTVLFSSSQRLFSRPHSPGAVLAGQRGGHEPGCLRPQQVQWGEGRADLPDVGVWKRCDCVVISCQERPDKRWCCHSCVCFLPQVTMPSSPYWSTTNVRMSPPAMSTPSQEGVSHPSRNDYLNSKSSHYCTVWTCRLSSRWVLRFCPVSSGKDQKHD